MKSSSNALVVHGNTGRAVQITIQDLQMPDRLNEKRNASFFAKQWSTVANFWYNRVLKESSLQQKSVSEIVQLIEKDIENRWEKRKLASTLRKKRQRILSSGSAGTPSNCILLTNVCPLDEYNNMNEEEKKKLKDILLEKIESITSSHVPEGEVVIDFEDSMSSKAHEKRIKTETGESTHNSSLNNEFDDRIAFVFSVQNQELAADAIAQLHGARLNQRRILCRFWNL